MGVLRTPTEMAHKFVCTRGEYPFVKTVLVLTLEIADTDFRKTVYRSEEEIGREYLLNAASDDFSPAPIQDMLREARLAIKRDIDKANAWLEGAA